MDDITCQNQDQVNSPATHQHGRDGSQKAPEPDSGGGNQCYTVNLFGVQIAALIIDGQERLCLAQISNTLLKKFSYNEIHNRRVALGITCVQCTPVQLEILRRANAMPVSSRRCGMINKREAERLCKSFLTENSPPKLPENFSFDVYHESNWGCRGAFVPSRYNSSRAKCIRCAYCNLFSSPNKFIFHWHRTPTSKFHPQDGPNFNSWRRHIKLVDPNPSDDLLHAWEDVKAMFNGGSRKRSVCDSSSKLAPSSFSSRPAVDSISLSGPAQRLLPSPPKRGRYEHEPHRELDLTTPGAASLPYPLMPIPSRSMSSSITDTLPECQPINSSPTFPVSAVFPGQLSPPGFRQHPYMEFLWGGGRAGYPVPAAAVWPKTLGMPFAGNASYYHPLVDPDTDIHRLIEMGSPSGTASKKTQPWDDLDSVKFGSMKPKRVPMRHGQHLPDLRRNAYYTSAFRPVLTAKGCLDPERAFTNAERFLFSRKGAVGECCIAMQDHHADPNPHQQQKHHQIDIKDDDDTISKSPANLTAHTPKLTVEVDSADKTDTEATVKSMAGTRSADADAGADSPDECGESHRERCDLETARSKRTVAVAEMESPQNSPDIPHMGDRPPAHRHFHHGNHIKASPTPSTSTDDEEQIRSKQSEGTGNAFHGCGHVIQLKVLPNGNTSTGGTRSPNNSLHESIN